MAARCQEISVQTVLRITLNASTKKRPRYAVLSPLPSYLPILTRHVRNGDPPKGAWSCLDLVHLFIFPIKLCRKSRVSAGKDGEPPTTGVWSNWHIPSLIFLIIPSSVPMPILHQNWEHLLIGKLLCDSPYLAPSRQHPVPPRIDRPPGSADLAPLL
jgi:hypothetical protein